MMKTSVTMKTSVIRDALDDRHTYWPCCLIYLWAFPPPKDKPHSSLLQLRRQHPLIHLWLPSSEPGGALCLGCSFDLDHCFEGGCLRATIPSWWRLRVTARPQSKHPDRWTRLHHRDLGRYELSLRVNEEQRIRSQTIQRFFDNKQYFHDIKNKYKIKKSPFEGLNWLWKKSYFLVFFWNFG